MQEELIIEVTGVFGDLAEGMIIQGSPFSPWIELCSRVIVCWERESREIILVRWKSKTSATAWLTL